MADVMRDPRVLLAACLLHPLPVALATAIKEVLATAPQQQAEPDHETRAELAEQQVVQLAEERDHYRRLLEKAQQTEPAAYGYASRLAVAIWEKHYKDTAPHWKPLDDLMGVLTQIDNMTSGLTRLAQQAEPVQRKPARWTEL